MINNSSSNLTDKKVLVLDDDSNRLARLKEILEKRQAVTYIASSIQSLIEKAAFFNPHVCIISLSLGSSNLIAINELLRANPITAKIRVVYQGDINSLLMTYNNTAYANTEHRFDFITWPYNEDEILLRMSMVIADLTVMDLGDEQSEFPCEISLNCSRFDKIIFTAAHKIIRFNMSNTVGIKELARQVGTNTKRLGQTFRRVCNMTVYQYIIEVKMMVAAQLLRETDLDIRFISLDLGYSSQANFSTAFRYKYGTSPRDFRKNGLTDADKKNIGYTNDLRPQSGRQEQAAQPLFG